MKPQDTQAIKLETESLQDWRAVMEYINGKGRKLGKSKLFQDIQKGRLKKQPGGAFRLRDVGRYMAGLPMSGTSDLVAENSAYRQRRKEEEEIRRIKAVADKEEFDLAVKQGRYILKEQVHLELAARAVVLASGIKTAFEAHSLECIAAMDGNPTKSPALTERLTDILDQALNEYSQEMEFEVTFIPAEGEAEKGAASEGAP